MKRILQIVQRSQRRGAEMFVYDLSRELERLGMQLKTVYLYDSDGEHSLPLHPSDICLHGPEFHVFERFAGLHPSLLRGVTREIKDFAPDIVQVNGSRTVKYGAAAKRIIGSDHRWKLLYRNIGIASDWHHSAGKLLVYRRAIMPQMDGVVSVSDTSLFDAKSLYGLRVPSTVIPNGINASRLEIFTQREDVRRRHGTTSRDVVLLFVGYLEPAKRPDRFVNVVSRVHHELPNIRGWVIGDGPLREEAERLTSRLGLGERILFLGAREDVPAYMNAADILVITSDSEGVPAVALEAGYLRLPVVTTGVGGLSECVIDGETGLVTEGTSEKRLAEAIRMLVFDKSLRMEMGEKAGRRVRASFTIDHVAERYLNFYREVQKGRTYAHV